MTDEYMTLAEALATGLPFKHKHEHSWVCNDERIHFTASLKDAHEPVWEVQRPNDVKVWHSSGSTGQFFFGPLSSVKHIAGIKEATPEQLKQIREALGIKDNG
jgi:hypothetical protein